MHRRKLRFLVIGAALLALTIGIVGYLGRGAPAAAQENPFVAKGRYLATAGPCRECHTPRKEGDPTALDLTKAFAGGEKFDLPFGAIWSANITPDVDTGVGGATDEQIKRAITDGIGIDGRKLVLLPTAAFPEVADE